MRWYKRFVVELAVGKGERLKPRTFGFMMKSKLTEEMLVIRIREVLKQNGMFFTIFVQKLFFFKSLEWRENKVRRE